MNFNQWYELAQHLAYHAQLTITRPAARKAYKAGMTAAEYIGFLEHPISLD